MGLHHLCWVRTFQCGCFEVTHTLTHCSMSKPNTFNGSQGWLTWEDSDFLSLGPWGVGWEMLLSAPRANILTALNQCR